MFKTICIYMGIIILIFCIGYATASLINKGELNEYKTTISELTSTNGDLIKLNSEAKEYNKRLKTTIEEFEAFLTRDYQQLEDGLGMAGTTIDELGNAIESATLQISAIIDSISELLETIGEL